MRIFLALLTVMIFSCSVPVDTQWVKAYEKDLSKQTEIQILNLSFLGDIMAHEENYKMKDFNNIYDDLRPILIADDLTFGNLEFSIDDSKPYSPFPFFNVHSDYVEAAIKGGFDVFSLANNHINDGGAKSVGDSLSAMKSLAQIYPIKFSGLREKADDPWMVTDISVKGWKIGFWSMTEFLNCLGGSELVYTGEFLNSAEKTAVLDFVEEQASQYDLFIMAIHSGNEYLRFPEPYRVRFFDELIRAGADIVWGHHPHVLQPWVQTEIDGEPKLILYSAGNFISHQFYYQSPKAFSDTTYKGEMALYKVSLAKTGNNITMQVGTIPLTNFNDPKKGMVVLQLKNTDSPDLPEIWRKYYSTRWPDFQKILYNHLEYPIRKNF